MKKLLQSSVYDHVINQLVPLLNARCPSHLLLGYLLPLSDEYTLKVREGLGLTAVQIPNITQFQTRMTYSEPLAPELTKHLNIWTETLR